MRYDAMTKEKLKRKRPVFTAARILVLGFLALIFIGAAFLMLPAATKQGGISFLDALFTATSATCVTGLAVFDTNATFTVFGQIIILFLIQIGGIGFMSTTSFIYMAFSKHISLSTRLTLKEDIVEGDFHYVKRLIVRIIVMTAVAEGAGAIILSGAFSRYMSAGEAIWSGIFHSVSAYCNAGFDIIKFDNESVTYFNSDPLVLLTISALIIFGGIGFVVVSDIWDKKIWRKFRLHTKIVLGMTAGLLLFSTAAILGIEYDNPETLGEMKFGDKLLNAFFMGVSTRTAGFVSFDINAMKPATKVCFDFLMFIGASPSSTGGGIKTTTLFVLMTMVYNVIRQRRFSIVDKQTIGYNTVYRAASVLVLALLNMVVAVGLLLITDGNNFTAGQLLFEQISAYGTVGLSLGVTPLLSVSGKLIIMLAMFLGRVGVLTFFISFTNGKEDVNKIIYPECQINI